MTTAAANGVPVLERQHLEDLHASGLSDEQISLCGFYSEKSPSRVSELLRASELTSSCRSKRPSRSARWSVSLPAASS